MIRLVTMDIGDAPTRPAGPAAPGFTRALRAATTRPSAGDRAANATTQADALASPNPARPPRQRAGAGPRRRVTAKRRPGRRTRTRLARAAAFNPEGSDTAVVAALSGASSADRGRARPAGPPRVRQPAFPAARPEGQGEAASSVGPRHGSEAAIPKAVPPPEMKGRGADAGGGSPVFRDMEPVASPPRGARPSAPVDPGPRPSPRRLTDLAVRVKTVAAVHSVPLTRAGSRPGGAAGPAAPRPGRGASMISAAPQPAIGDRTIAVAARRAGGSAPVPEEPGAQAPARFHRLGPELAGDPRTGVRRSRAKIVPITRKTAGRAGNRFPTEGAQPPTAPASGVRAAVRSAPLGSAPLPRGASEPAASPAKVVLPRVWRIRRASAANSGQPQIFAVRPPLRDPVHPFRVEVHGIPGPHAEVRVRFAGAVPAVLTGSGVHALGQALRGHAGRVEVSGAGEFGTSVATHGGAGGGGETGRERAQPLSNPAAGGDGPTGPPQPTRLWERGGGGIDFRA